MKYIPIVILFLFCDAAFAERFRGRIREHFEFHSISQNGQSFDYRGTGNTLNIWYEKPFKYSYGLAYGPLLGNNKAQDGSQAFGGEINILRLGAEGKYFPMEIPLFVRGGIYASELDRAGANVKGFSVYGGVGWEFLFKGVGIALEMSVMQSEFADDISATTLNPSIGFHFYEML